MMTSRRWGRRAVVAVTTAALATTVAACGGGSTSGSGGDKATGTVRFWSLKDPTNEVQQSGIDAFNKTGDGRVTLDTVPSDGYLDKLRVAMGTSAAPGMFFSWGGGPMREYASANKIVDVSTLPDGASIADNFLPSVLKIGETNDGKLVGVPCRGTQPVFLFYNKRVFQDAGVKPPTTMDDLMSLVTTFKSKNVIPLALAGSGDSSWTELMYLEYLTDRIGGPEVFQKIQSGDASGWKDPAILQAAQTIRSLVDAGAFGTSFGSVAYGAGGSSTLVSSGKAAMQLMGSWEYATQSGADPDFAKNDLGYVAFPSVEGGKGDPADVVGNPSNYVSVNVNAPANTAAGYLKTLYSDDYVAGLVKMGEVPVTKNAATAIEKADNVDYAKFQYNMVANAPSFTQSWDQALGFKIATPMLAELQKLFNGQTDPSGFVSTVSTLS